MSRLQRLRTFFLLYLALTDWANFRRASGASGLRGGWMAEISKSTARNGCATNARETQEDRLKPVLPGEMSERLFTECDFGGGGGFDGVFAG